MNQTLSNYADELALLACICVALAAAAWWLLRRHRSGRTGSTRRNRLLLAAVAALLLTPFLYITLARGYGEGRTVSLVPLHEMWLSASSVQMAFSDVSLINYVGNMALLVPFGALAPFVLGGSQPLARTTWAAAAVSVCVEVMQYVFALGRVSSVDDVLLNATGAALGALCTRRWWKATSARAGTARRGSSAARPAASSSGG